VAEQDPKINSSNVNSGTDMPEAQRTFLAKVMAKSGLTDPYDARDITEVVFRVMRDLMTTEASDRVESELHQTALETQEKSLQLEVSDLWKDTNPIVGFLSRLRPPLKGPGLSGINDERFLSRVKNEAGVPPSIDSNTAIEAIFAAMKDELSEERASEIATCLPGKVAEMWQQAR
jgi:uncharacterized protein (DUF2267 family)